MPAPRLHPHRRRSASELWKLAQEAGDHSRQAAAVRLCRQALQVVPTDPTAGAEVHAQILVTLACYESELGRPDVGLALLDEALRVDPKSSAAVWTARGLVLLKSGDKGALDALDQAVRMLSSVTADTARPGAGPSDLASALLNRGVLHMVGGRLTAAQRDTMAAEAGGARSRPTGCGFDGTTQPRLRPIPCRCPSGSSRRDGHGDGDGARGNAGCARPGSRKGADVRRFAGGGRGVRRRSNLGPSCQSSDAGLGGGVPGQGRNPATQPRRPRCPQVCSPCGPDLSAPWQCAGHIDRTFARTTCRGGLASLRPIWTSLAGTSPHSRRSAPRPHRRGRRGCTIRRSCLRRSCRPSASGQSLCCRGAVGRRRSDRSE